MAYIPSGRLLPSVIGGPAGAVSLQEHQQGEPGGNRQHEGDSDHQWPYRSAGLRGRAREMAHGILRARTLDQPLMLLQIRLSHHARAPRARLPSVIGGPGGRLGMGGWGMRLAAIVIENEQAEHGREVAVLALLALFVDPRD
jgi:hypothetical protein